MGRLTQLMLLFALVLAPAQADAQQTDPDVFWGATIGAGVPALAFDGVLFALAIDAWAEGRYGLEDEWAIVELVWGALHLAGVGVAIGVSTLAYDPVPLALTFGVPLGVFGAYFVTHALLSLFAEPTLEVSISASHEGALATVGARF